jgi:hypothetical protein
MTESFPAFTISQATLLARLGTDQMAYSCVSGRVIGFNSDCKSQSHESDTRICLLLSALALFRYWPGKLVPGMENAAQGIVGQTGRGITNE